MLRLAALALLSAGCLALPAARAQTAAAGLRDFCAQRPGKGTPACVVDPGHLMLEVDALDVATTRDAGVSTRTTLAGGVALRLGLTDTIEAAIALPPFERVTVRDRLAGARTRTSGLGDAQAALKISLAAPDGKGTSAALLPFVSLPTAQHGLGGGGFQGGVILPVSFDLPAGFNLTVDPEVDVLRNGGGGGVHPAYVGVVSLSHDLAAGVNGSAELWSSLDDAPGVRTTQSTFDLSLAWIPHGHANLQLDGGVNLGLDRRAPRVQAYVGVARRF
jgi:hypothetical protein